MARVHSIKADNKPAFHGLQLLSSSEWFLFIDSIRMHCKINKTICIRNQATCHHFPNNKKWRYFHNFISKFGTLIYVLLISFPSFQFSHFLFPVCHFLKELFSFSSDGRKFWQFYEVRRFTAAFTKLPTPAHRHFKNVDICKYDSSRIHLLSQPLLFLSLTVILSKVHFHPLHRLSSVLPLVTKFKIIHSISPLSC